MGNVEVRARIREVSGGLFKLDVIVVRAATEFPEKTTEELGQTFFSRAEAKKYARNELGLSDARIS